MEINSRTYANFKRLFVGPKIPKKIKKERNIGYAPPMPVSKPARADKKWKTPKLDKNDWRCVRHGATVYKIACPKWADKDAIDRIYNEAKRLTETSDIKHQVDHIIPLRHPLVCGLHVEHNLQIITAADNRTKSNTFILG